MFWCFDNCSKAKSSLRENRVWELSQHRVEAAAAWTVETHSIQPSSKQDVKMLGVVVLVLCLFGSNAFKTENVLSETLCAKRLEDS